MTQKLNIITSLIAVSTISMVCYIESAAADSWGEGIFNIATGGGAMSKEPTAEEQRQALEKKFNAYMQKRGNAPPTPEEINALKSYQQ